MLHLVMTIVMRILVYIIKRMIKMSMSRRACNWMAVTKCLVPYAPMMVLLAMQATMRRPPPIAVLAMVSIIKCMVVRWMSRSLCRLNMVLRRLAPVPLEVLVLVMLVTMRTPYCRRLRACLVGGRRSPRRAQIKTTSRKRSAPVTLNRSHHVERSEERRILEAVEVRMPLLQVLVPRRRTKAECISLTRGGGWEGRQPRRRRLRPRRGCPHPRGGLDTT